MRQLTPHIFLLEIPNLAGKDSYLVREPDGDTLVDPGPIGTAPFLLALDRRGEIRLRRVILTHADAAHAGSVARVQRGTGVRIFVHPLDMPFLDGRKRPPPPRGLLSLVGYFVDLCPPVFRLEPLIDAVGSLEPHREAGSTRLFHREDRFWLPQ